MGLRMCFGDGMTGGHMLSRKPISMGRTRDSETRRLLIISYHFPPDGAVGGQRWAGLSKYLVRLGWEVHVITASAGGPQDATPGVYRHFSPRRRTLTDR